MGGLFDEPFKGQKHRRQERDAAEHADDDALDHHHAQVTAQREGHEDQRREARDGGDGGADDGHEGLRDGRGHGVLAGGVGGLGGLVAVQQEDGVVHRDAQLQDRHQRLGDVGDLAQEHVGAHVVHDGHADGGQEDERQHEGRGGQHQHQQRQR